jgi:hypothetical protein
VLQLLLFNYKHTEAQERLGQNRKSIHFCPGRLFVWSRWLLAMFGQAVNYRVAGVGIQILQSKLIFLLENDSICAYNPLEELVGLMKLIILHMKTTVTIHHAAM